MAFPSSGIEEGTLSSHQQITTINQPEVLPMIIMAARSPARITAMRVLLIITIVYTMKATVHQSRLSFFQERERIIEENQQLILVLLPMISPH